MFGIENFIVFMTTGILLNLMPGPDSLYIIGRSLSQGRSAGIFAVLGISTGSLFHTFMGAFGLSAILLSSAKAFMFVKYAGAIYLFYQAILLIKDSRKESVLEEIEIPKENHLKVFEQGAITNILNPKVALFFMALLPQFISATSPSKFLSFIFLGSVFITTGTIWCLLLAIFSSFFGKKLRSSSEISKWLLRLNAGLFAYLGIRLVCMKAD